MEFADSIARNSTTARVVGTANYNVRVTDGTFGWEEEAPFDGIVVTAGAPAVPHPYREQLTIGGRLVIPVGDRVSQVLMRVTRLSERNFREERLFGCRFVPLVGDLGWREE